VEDQRSRHEIPTLESPLRSCDISYMRIIYNIELDKIFSRHTHTHAVRNLQLALSACTSQSEGVSFEDGIKGAREEVTRYFTSSEMRV